MAERNVLGGPLEPCGTDPLTGYYRDGCCSTGPEDLGRHTICAVMTAEFLEHQRSIGNDLLTPVPEYRFPGLLPGDRWCVTALNWLRAHHDGCAAPVVVASTHERTLEVVPIEALLEHQVDVPVRGALPPAQAADRDQGHVCLDDRRCPGGVPHQVDQPSVERRRTLLACGGAHRRAVDHHFAVDHRPAVDHGFAVDRLARLRARRAHAHRSEPGSPRPPG